jgi:hypothetical protein
MGSPHENNITTHIPPPSHTSRDRNIDREKTMSFEINMEVIDAFLADNGETAVMNVRLSCRMIKNCFDDGEAGVRELSNRDVNKTRTARIDGVKSASKLANA